MVKYSEDLHKIIATTIRTNICDVGTKIICERGWGEFTIQNIAKELGVSRSMLYNYFDSKEEVVGFILMNAMDKLLNKIQPIVESEISSKEKILSISRVIVSNFGEEKELHRTVRTNVPIAQLKKAKNKPMRSKIDDIFEKVIAQGVENGEFCDCNVKITACFLHGGVQTICNHMYFNEEILVNNIEEWLEIFLKGLVNEKK